MTEKEFISRYISKHTEINSKNFPDDYTNLNNTKELFIPDKTLVLGSELFGSVEILTTEGEPVLQAETTIGIHR